MQQKILSCKHMMKFIHRLRRRQADTTKLLMQAGSQTEAGPRPVFPSIWSAVNSLHGWLQCVCMVACSYIGQSILTNFCLYMGEGSRLATPMS